MVVAAPNPFAFTAVAFGELPVNDWYAPNPDPTVTDSRLLYVDRDTGLTLVRGRARPKQRPPTVPYFVWLVLAGRGFGKTRTGTEWIDAEARVGAPGEQFIVAGRTPDDVEKYTLHGPGGLLTNHPDVEHRPGKRLLIWPNGVVGIIRSGANPEEFRGFSGRRALLDEFGAWRYALESWRNLVLGMREGRDPKVGIMTTGRPIPVLKQIRSARSTVCVCGSSYENRANLAEVYVKEVLDPISSTRHGRQEVGGEILEDVPGALWKYETIERHRWPDDKPLPDFKRKVVGVDPQGTKSEDVSEEESAAGGMLLLLPGHETGIVVAAVDNGKPGTEHVYVLADRSVNGTPTEWGDRAVNAYHDHEADRVVGETNYGGEMVGHVVHTIDNNVAFKKVTASRGKRPRAEPVSALYDQGRVHHVGYFPELETEQTSYTPEDSKRSPNRMDALVWAITELVLERKKKRAGVVTDKGLVG